MDYLRFDFGLVHIYILQHPVEEEDAPACGQGAKDRSDSEKSSKVASKTTGGDHVSQQTTTWEEEK